MLRVRPLFHAIRTAVHGEAIPGLPNQTDLLSSELNTMTGYVLLDQA